MKDGDIIPFVADTMFKIILGSESKKENTAYLLSLLLDRDRKEIEENMLFVKKEQDQQKYKGAKRVVDLIVKWRGFRNYFKIYWIGCGKFRKNK